MLQLITTLTALIFLVLCCQGYRYAITRTGKAKQEICQHHGIFFTTLGIGTFLIPSVPVVFAGLILIMLGLRLIEHGLNRLEKSESHHYPLAAELAVPRHGRN